MGSRPSEGKLACFLGSEDKPSDGVVPSLGTYLKWASFSPTVESRAEIMKSITSGSAVELLEFII